MSLSICLQLTVFSPTAQVNDQVDTLTSEAEEKDYAINQRHYQKIKLILEEEYPFAIN